MSYCLVNLHGGYRSVIDFFNLLRTQHHRGVNRDFLVLEKALEALLVGRWRIFVQKRAEITETETRKWDRHVAQVCDVDSKMTVTMITQCKEAQC